MLVKKTARWAEYELTYLVGSGYTTTEMSSLQDEMVSLVGKNGGEILETANWGKRPLAYKIKKDGKTHTEAVYTQLVVKLPVENSQSLARNVELKKAVLRSLLVIRTAQGGKVADKRKVV
jgi:small subunit ribosomal protein S6